MKRIFVVRFELLELFADSNLEPARHGMIILNRVHVLGKIRFSGRESVGFVVRVAIVLTVAEIFHQIRRCVEDVLGGHKRPRILGVAPRRG